MINKIGRPRSGSPICLITSMITDRIGLHSVLLPLLILITVKINPGSLMWFSKPETQVL